MSRAWFLNWFGLHFKILFKNPVVSLDLLVSETRSEFVTSAKGSVSVWLALVLVPYSCWRRTVTPEPTLCQSCPKMSPFLAICRHIVGVDWKFFPEVGRTCLVVFSM